jgi:hypothetical protein
METGKQVQIQGQIIQIFLTLAAMFIFSIDYLHADMILQIRYKITCWY